MQSYLETKQINKIKYRRSMQRKEPDQTMGYNQDGEAYQEEPYVNETVEEIAKRLGQFDYGGA